MIAPTPKELAAELVTFWGDAGRDEGTVRIFGYRLAAKGFQDSRYVAQNLRRELEHFIESRLTEVAK